jgi:hypothetical protein
MTAINVIRQANAVHVLTDGIVCNSEGVISEIGPNTFTLPNLPAALAIRGPTQFMPFLVHRLSRECQSFDELLKNIVPAALDVHMSIPMTLGYGEVRPNFDLVVAGWSNERGRPESFVMTNQEPRDQIGLATAAWQLMRLPDVSIAPSVGMAQIKSVGWRVPESAEAFQPSIDGIKLLHAQRLSKGLRPALPNRDTDSVGGFVQLTTVHAHGISSTLLHRWPDRVGQRIALGQTGAHRR